MLLYYSFVFEYRWEGLSKCWGACMNDGDYWFEVYSWNSCKLMGMSIGHMICQIFEGPRERNRQ